MEESAKKPKIKSFVVTMYFDPRNTNPTRIRQALDKFHRETPGLSGGMIYDFTPKPVKERGS